MLPLSSSRSSTLSMSNFAYLASATPRATFSKSQNSAMLVISAGAAMHYSLLSISEMVDTPFPLDVPLSLAGEGLGGRGRAPSICVNARWYRVNETDCPPRQPHFTRLEGFAEGKGGAAPHRSFCQWHYVKPPRVPSASGILKP